MKSKKQMLTKVGHGILKTSFFVACSCALKKKTYKVKITLEADFIKHPFLQLYAKLKGNTHDIKKTDADESRPRDFET